MVNVIDSVSTEILKEEFSVKLNKINSERDN